MSQGCKDLTRPTPTIYMTGFTPTVYMTGLIRRFSRKRNMPSRRIQCCYIIIGTEFKGKYILEQDELFCCAIICSEPKEKTSYVTKTKKEKNKRCLSFLPP